jgi:hypothetical protein
MFVGVFILFMNNSQNSLNNVVYSRLVEQNKSGGKLSGRLCTATLALSVLALPSH